MVAITETLVTFAQAAERVPGNRGRQHACEATITRWADRGVEGIVLETTWFGGKRGTSLEALQRFFDACNEWRQQQRAGTPVSSERREHQAASMALARMRRKHGNKQQAA